MEPSAPTNTPARERSAPRAEPPLAPAEAIAICGVLAAGLASCWMLYGPLITQMFRLMRESLR